ncbi:putative methyltransferase At1g22800, mitochondrial isoform X3 [Magnolia sinica]|uniref:putative methyltransferase At1g22800, mitochondrial isoform X3 n=1 Tax=Magnolia sinica TaxID=86752 RepID=UPI00265B19B4|nr:putative methyltransferase At1g22800, mitochondrial isoform X3 [Magnolia sinica]
MRGLSVFGRGRVLLLSGKRLEPSLIFSHTFCTDGDNSRLKVFDRHLKRKQRDRAAWLMPSKDTFIDSVAENLLDRLEDCKRTFPTALCLGGSLAAVRRLLRGRGAIQKLIMMDMSYDMVKLCKDAEADVSDNNLETHFVVGDEEFLPIKERELRIACTIAQLEREGGISPRISPLAQVRDAGNLLTRAGFTLPGVDVDEYTVRYDSALELIEHLRAMGETNALFQRNNILKKDTALASAAVYQSMFEAEDGTVPATFQSIPILIRHLFRHRHRLLTDPVVPASSPDKSDHPCWSLSPSACPCCCVRSRS